MAISLPCRLSYLFGTEEYIEIRKELVLLRENIYNISLKKDQRSMICSGSIGEGISHPKSDDDLMRNYDEFRVVESFKEAKQNGDLLMVPSEFPGYCILMDVWRKNNDSFTYVVDQMDFFSSMSWKKFFLEKGDTIHGPCISTVDGSKDLDLARSFSLSFWPAVSHEWAIKTRFYGWPSDETVNAILTRGCNVVPIGHPDSVLCQHEWRLSFSVAERTLMHSLNHAQFLTYNLMRLTLKCIIEKDIPEVLCSYFMKTALFYSIENKHAQIWQVDHIEKCFQTCLSMLYEFVDQMNCPNYFIPDYNMIGRKVNATNQCKLLELIKRIYSVGIYGILHLCGESYCLRNELSLRTIEFELDIDLKRSVLFTQCRFECARMFYGLTTFESCTFNFYQFLHLLELRTRGTHHNVTNLILQAGIISFCERLMDFCFCGSKENRSVYCINKSIRSLLRLGIRGDLTTGKLTIATYFFMLGRTDSALSVIRHLLSEYPPYVMDEFLDEIKVATYKDLMCGRGHTVNYKARCSWATGFYLTNKFLNAFPLPLRIFLSISERVFFNPLTYAYLLEGLCYVRQQSTLFEKAIRCLINLNSGKTSVENRLYSRMCVGIIKYSLRDNQSACRWFGSIISMMDIIPEPFNKEVQSSIWAYMACLLNFHFHQ